MGNFNVLILTDHTNHSKENSVYSIVNSLSKHALVNRVDIATRGNFENNDFFKHLKSEILLAAKVDGNFKFSKDGLNFNQNVNKVLVSEYDLIWLRLPPPLTKSFLDFK